MASVSMAYGKFLHESFQSDARSNAKLSNTKFEVLTPSDNALF